MANTCYTSIYVTGAAAELEAMNAQMAEALTIPDSGNENWIGNLWLHMGLDPELTLSGKLGQCAAEITGHELRDGVLHVETESEWHPRLKALHDFMLCYAPSAKMDYFAMEPHMNLFHTSAADGEYAMVSFHCSTGSDDPKTRELDDWKSLWKKDELFREMSEKLSLDMSNGFNAVADAFMAVYPVAVDVLAHEDLEKYLK